MLTIQQHKPYFTGITTSPTQIMHQKQPAQALSNDVFISRHSNDTSKLTFKGLTNALSSKIYETSEEIKNLFAKHTESNGIVGKLPSSWTTQTTKKDASDIYNGLAKTSQTLMEPIKHLMRNYTEYYIDKNGNKIIIMDPEINMNVEYDMSPAMKKASVILTNTLKSHNIISQKEKVNIELSKVDTTASYFVFSAGSEAFTMKVFHPFYEDNFFKNKGKYIEGNRAAYIEKNCPDSNYAKFYCEDLNNNYMLLKHLTERDPEPKNIFNARHYGLVEFAHSRKRTGHYINDYGALVINKTTILANNKIARETFKSLQNTPEQECLSKFKELMKKQDANKKDVLVGLALSINVLEKSDRTQIIQQLIKMNHSSEMKEAIASRLNFIEENDIPAVITKLLEGAEQHLIDKVMNRYQIYFQQD